MAHGKQSSLNKQDIVVNTYISVRNINRIKLNAKTKKINNQKDLTKNSIKVLRTVEHVNIPLEPGGGEWEAGDHEASEHPGQERMFSR